MEKLWKAAIGVGGIAAIGAFVFWSLYKDWLTLPLFSQLTADQTFLLMLIFLSLTFLSLIAMLIVYSWTKHLEGKNSRDSSVSSKVDLVNASLDRHNQNYEEITENRIQKITPTKSIKP